MKDKKVFVSGCFDMLHSGHIAFFKEAAQFGDLFVGIGADQTIQELKGRPTVYTQEERKYMISELKCVKECLVNRGSGILDFLEELDNINPDVFVVNEDGNTYDKMELCKSRNIQYIVLKREPYPGLPQRSTTDLRTIVPIPYRIDLAGTWIDQPYVSKYHPGSAILISIEPTIEFFERSGMATSTRRAAYHLWPAGIPIGKPEDMARMLFYFDNPPGTKEVSGTQDALGIVLPGLNKIFYDGSGYWPAKIESIYDEDILSWLETHIRLVILWPRPENFSVLEETYINTDSVKRLVDAAQNCWDAIIQMDLEKFGKYLKNSFEAQVTMFPAMLNDKIEEVIKKYEDKAFGWKLTGAGGGGYLVLVTDKGIKETIKIKIRRRSF
jgi:cytidyltransferase-like protein